MAKIGLVLSGCGVYDGSELQETIMSVYFLEKRGAEIIYMAPNIDQMHVINHLTGDVMQGESRNVLVEAARISRGDIRDIKDVNVSDFDALMIPGGFGAAKNLTSFAVDGPDAKINDDVLRLVKGTLDAKKPLAAICIAPVIVAKALAGTGVESSITIGNEEGVAGALESLGAKHIQCPVQEAVVDEANKIITSPAYMLGQNILEISEGIEAAVDKLYALM
ncbi:isoprenoid biosynthesis glyoxalase ElbB [Limisalsivibrio acetivorans]|uniref:isoprenoid biosynthesis glyoxalase ElbB n=1 Tax=Limisalsivibrio acetivorans TaxID=1304888 RepID=UPI0003B63B65|nr:isoprenoid biosynthesis glyoxalase ElbB [Limisalsivibrio acetivorans]